ncbi:inositol 2-dehydrogenase [Halanaerobium sp. Z-7514]|uniref:Inositol 2-dehydrogenase n=1 Tax=Halanaerobium polyolivorans TaxID=2886943 RepID=A0AAW4X1X6_9FIRM|nr:inositol 2-dehydrogenase [Halanaerobium polyolivorans]MCC3145821.1 inositol 2-dehydrogenase [Halanaerobium polyolivorans]RQD76609.1 MAG: inositol 2-dehydrogenase [Halanaerobium sp. MSAO_Bac5]
MKKTFNSDKEKIRVAVLGMGRQGQIHSKNIAYRIPEAELLCVSDISIERAEKVGIEGVELYDDYKEILARDDVEAVVIATSTDTHEQIIKETARAGKDIFCEKPIALSLEAIDEVLDIVDENGVKFMVGFNRRFDPTFMRVKEHLTEGNIGEPHIVNITSRDPKPPHLEYLKVCGGIFFDTSVHDFDMARFLSEEEITEVYATGSVLVDERIGELGDLDTTMITLKFANGAVGSINNSRKTGYSYDQRVEVFGSNGCAIGNNERPNRVELTDPKGTHKDVPLYFNIERYPEAFFGEVNAFIKAVYNDEEPPVTGQDGRTAVVLSLAAQKSYEENRPVKVSEIG